MAKSELTEEQHLERVEQAMRSLGWEPGRKVPSITAILTKLTELHGGPGDGNKISARREKIVQSYEGLPQEQENLAAPSMLPNEIAGLLQGTATAIGAAIDSLDGQLAAFLERQRADMERVADERIEKVKAAGEAKAEQLTVELQEALTALNDRAIVAERTSAELVEAKQAAAVAEDRANTAYQDLAGAQQRADALGQDLQAAAVAKQEAITRADELQRLLDAASAQIARQAEELKEATAATATATGRADELQRQLEQATARISTLEQQLQEATAATATATGRAQVLQDQVKELQAATRVQKAQRGDN